MKRSLRLFSAFVLLCILCSFGEKNNRMINLEGNWRFQIDYKDLGVKEKWFNKPLNDLIYLPGSMAENRKGDDVTINTQWTASIYDSSFFYNPRLEKFRQEENLKIPFWLTPVKYYVGAAWYQKDVFYLEDDEFLEAIKGLLYFWKDLILKHAYGLIIKR